MTSNQGTTRHPFLIKTLILFLVAVLSVAPMSLAIVPDTAYADDANGAGGGTNPIENAIKSITQPSQDNNANNNNNNNNNDSTQTTPNNNSSSSKSSTSKPQPKKNTSNSKNGSKKKTGSSTDSPFDFGGVIGQLQTVVTVFLLPAAIIISGWKILYLAVFVGLIGFDPLHMIASDSAEPQSFGAVTGEIKRHCVSFVKGLCWIGSIFIIFQLVLVAASTIAGAFKTAFD